MNLKKYIPGTTEAVKIFLVVVVATAFGLTALGVKKVQAYTGRIR